MEIILEGELEFVCQDRGLGGGEERRQSCGS